MKIMGDQKSAQALYLVRCWFLKCDTGIVISDFMRSQCLQILFDVSDTLLISFQL